MYTYTFGVYIYHILHITYYIFYILYMYTYIYMHILFIVTHQTIYRLNVFVTSLIWFY